MATGIGLAERTEDLVRQGYQTRTGGSPPRQGEARPLRVHVLVYSKSADLFNKIVIAAREQASTSSYSVIERCEFDSKVTFADRVAELARVEDALLIVSDRFTAQPGDGDDLAALVRERSGDGRAVISLLALAEPSVRRIALVDGIVDGSAGADALAEAMQRALAAIRYKVPPAGKSLGRT